MLTSSIVILTPWTIINIIYLMYFLYFKRSTDTNNIIHKLFLYTFPVYSSIILLGMAYIWFIFIMISNSR